MSASDTKADGSLRGACTAKGWSMSADSGGRGGSVIALDVGGTRIKGGVLDSASRIRAERVVDTGRQDGPDAVTERILAVMTELADAGRAEGLTPGAAGVVLPAIVDEATGHVAFSANIGWRDFP